jgi:hypothetical protein
LIVGDDDDDEFNESVIIIERVDTRTYLKIVCMLLEEIITLK